MMVVMMVCVFTITVHIIVFPKLEERNTFLFARSAPSARSAGLLIGGGWRNERGTRRERSASRLSRVFSVPVVRVLIRIILPCFSMSMHPRGRSSRARAMLTGTSSDSTRSSTLLGARATKQHITQTTTSKRDNCRRVKSNTVKFQGKRKYRRIDIIGGSIRQTRMMPEITADPSFA